MNKSVRILTALAVGTVTGLIAGLLLAPGKGSDTRKRIADKGKKLVEDIEEKLKKGKDKIATLKGDMKEKVEEYI